MCVLASVVGAGRPPPPRALGMLSALHARRLLLSVSQLGAICICTRTARVVLSRALGLCVDELFSFTRPRPE